MLSTVQIGGPILRHNTSICEYTPEYTNVDGVDTVKLLRGIIVDILSFEIFNKNLSL